MHIFVLFFKVGSCKMSSSKIEKVDTKVDTNILALASFSLLANLDICPETLGIKGKFNSIVKREIKIK